MPEPFGPALLTLGLVIVGMAAIGLAWRRRRLRQRRRRERDEALLDTMQRQFNYRLDTDKRSSPGGRDAVSDHPGPGRTADD